LPLQCLQPLS